MAVYDLMNANILNPAIPATFANSTSNPPQSDGFQFQSLASRGGFVDLLYPYLAGSPLREKTLEARTVVPTPRIIAPATLPAVVPNVQLNYGRYMNSDLSAFQIDPAALSPLKHSGKLVHFGAGGDICFMQPTYDTWTDAYESDGFDQSQSFNGAVNSATPSGTTWVLNNLDASGLTRTPRLLDPTAALQFYQIDTGRQLPTSLETSPPFAIDVPAISVTVRIADPNADRMTQFTIIESLE